MSSPSERLTPAQQDAIIKAHEILGEHFDTYVLITTTKSDDNESVERFLSFEGGAFNALGLITQTQHDMLSGG